MMGYAFFSLLAALLLLVMALIVIPRPAEQPPSAWLHGRKVEIIETAYGKVRVRFLDDGSETVVPAAWVKVGADDCS
jgi:hypothetical protein